ncbi:putative 2-phosphosulfolactate phosphatase [Propionigenium maris DSM 9537]|uniref:Probable 2-phosphosulfolactate phosphatase n=1 Tax=Propionigenium maris DSM 9537 TaxID=1123000 RepID=A0A9W6GK02_9FUSO|nr:2-phosphosulfolactate phosphatase [Propionigenium maris]GLI56543.1 putative 2-phosphosulfolactate phosphatase [Propionigenium maris DSM 9537]
MKVDIIFTADDIKREKIEGRNIVVIDVLRATSVMVTAMARGVEEIHVFKDVEEVFEAGRGRVDAILCGERRGLKVEGFHYGNSPLEYGEEIEGKRMYMTTSNGTKALVGSNSGRRVFTGSFLNLDAVVKRVLEEDEDLVVVCAGTDGEFSLDDALCAGMIAEGIAQKKREAEFTDSALAMRDIALGCREPKDRLAGSRHYSYLESIDFHEDLDYCLSLNLYDIVPEYREGVVRAGRLQD